MTPCAGMATRITLLVARQRSALASLFLGQKMSSRSIGSTATASVVHAQME